MNVKEALTAILSKSMPAEQVYSQVSPEMRAEIEVSLAYIGELHKANKEFYDYESASYSPKEHEAVADGRKYQGGDPKHAGKGPTRAGNERAPVIHGGAMPHTGISDKGVKVRNITPFGKEEVCKFDSNGQWKMEKAGSIDYAKMNAPAKMKPESPSIDYGKMNAVQKQPEGPAMDYSKHNVKPDYKSIEEKAPTIDYNKMNDPANQKPAWKQKTTPASQKEAWMKVNRQRNEMAARGIKKDEGVMIDRELKDKSRMVAKDDVGAVGGSLAQSEKEPHKDDRKHEAKEKKLFIFVIHII